MCSDHWIYEKQSLTKYIYDTLDSNSKIYIAMYVLPKKCLKLNRWLRLRPSVPSSLIIIFLSVFYPRFC